MSSLVLEHGDGVPRFWREVGAALISPSTGFNRLAYGDRFGPIFSSRGAPYYSRLQLGLSDAKRNLQGTSTEFKRNEVLADYYLGYGLPGKPGYEYTRPFDYFNFQATASSANVFENIQTRGLLAGKAYERGRDFRGVWGLYGSYDYISPQTYRIFTVRVNKQHAIAVKYLWNRRDATTSFLGNGTQENATIGIFYSYVGKRRRSLC